MESKLKHRDLDEFEAWCDEHFGEVNNDTAEKAFERFREDQQGQYVKYAW